MTATEQNITEYTAGDSLDIEVPVTDGPAGSGEPFPLGGATVRWVLSRRRGGETVVEKSTADGPTEVEITDPEGGVFYIHIHPDDTAGLDANVYYHEAEVVGPTGTTWTVFRGSFEIGEDTA